MKVSSDGNFIARRSLVEEQEEQREGRLGVKRELRYRRRPSIYPVTGSSCKGPI